MAETFSYCTRLGATGEIAQRTWQNDFGDGYVQSGGTGINTRSETWDGMTIIGRLEAGDDLLGARAFLDRHEGIGRSCGRPLAAHRVDTGAMDTS